MIICAGRSELLRGAVPVGVGLCEVVKNLTQIILEKSPTKLHFIGSAGSYGKFKPFDIVESCRATQVDVSFLLDYTYTPLTHSVYKNVSCETNTIVNSSNFITKDKDIAEQFLKMGYDLENMEFYAVIYLANEFGIKAKGTFVVTNYCDENAHEDYMKHHKKANKLMERIIEEKMHT
jgi:purine-nucleoside phosphorylase